VVPADPRALGLLGWTEALGKDARELFRERLDAIMATRALTNRALAKAIGVDPSVVTHWRKGSASPEMHRLSLIAATLGVPVHWFFVDTSEPTEVAARLREHADRIASEARELAEEAARVIRAKRSL
jgi:transcriptional regulator with XRE-family HTH domain